jgi:hypothetical protein
MNEQDLLTGVEDESRIGNRTPVASQKERRGRLGLLDKSWMKPAEQQSNMVFNMAIINKYQYLMAVWFCESVMVCVSLRPCRNARRCLPRLFVREKERGET